MNKTGKNITKTLNKHIFHVKGKVWTESEVSQTC